MFQLIDETTVVLTHINVRTEKHGQADVDAMDLDFELSGENRIVLGMLDDRLCAAYYFNAEAEAGQDHFATVTEALPNLRFSRLAPVIKWSDEATGVDLQVIYGLGDDESNIQLENGKAVMKTAELLEGGTATLKFRFSIAGYPDGALDKLRKKLKQEITITMVRPEKLRQDAVIDGSTEAFRRDHPEAGQPGAEEDLTEMFLAGKLTGGELPGDRGDDAGGPPNSDDDAGGPTGGDDTPAGDDDDEAATADAEAGPAPRARRGRRGA